MSFVLFVIGVAVQGPSFLRISRSATAVRLLGHHEPLRWDCYTVQNPKGRKQSIPHRAKLQKSKGLILEMLKIEDAKKRDMLLEFINSRMTATSMRSVGSFEVL